MAKYESKIKFIPAPVEAVYAKLSNFENLRPVIENASSNDMVRQKMIEAGQDPSILDNLKDVELSSDRVAMPGGMLGTLSLVVVEREENRCIKFQTEQFPVDANLWIQILPTTVANGQNAECAPDGSPTAAQGTKMRLTLKADLNPMVKMMIGSKLEDGLDKFADVLAMIPYQM